MSDLDSICWTDIVRRNGVIPKISTIELIEALGEAAYYQIMEGYIVH